MHFEASGILRPPITHTYRRRKIGEGMLGNKRKTGGGEDLGGTH